MADEIGDNVAALVAAASQHGAGIGIKHCRDIQAETEVLLGWLTYLRQPEVPGIADALLDGTQGAIVETAGCLALGLVRPALSSLRAEIDMILSWLYFKDHGVEWNHLRDTGQGFQTKMQVLKYIGEHWPKFGRRFKLLAQHRKRQAEDPYRLLSAHIHGQTDFTAPNVDPLVKLVAGPSLCAECVMLQRDVAEYIGDVLLAMYGDRWASLPDVVKISLNSRLNAKERKAFFA